MRAQPIKWINVEKIVGITAKNQYIIVGLVLLLICGYLLIKINGYGVSAVTAYETPITIKPDDLLDQYNKPFKSDQLLGHWTFMFFGFTHCPDVCPATLLQLAQLNRKFNTQERKNNAIQFLFVSVDPERDSRQHLAGYIKYFDSTFVAVTGQPATIADLESQVGAFHRIDKKGKNEFYSVQHSADVFLVAPDGRLVTRITPPLDINKVFGEFNVLSGKFSDAVT